PHCRQPKLLRPCPKDRPVPAIGYDPELRPRDRLVHLDGESHRVQFVAIPMHDQRPRRDSREVWRREVQVVIAVGEPSRHLPERPDLVVRLVPLTHLPPLGLATRLSIDGAHHQPRLLWKIWRRADEYHGRDTSRLLRGDMQQCLGPEADSYCFELIDLQVIEQGQHVQRTLAEGEMPAPVLRSTVSAQVGNDKAKARRWIAEDQVPVRPGTA